MAGSAHTCLLCNQPLNKIVDPNNLWIIKATAIENRVADLLNNEECPSISNLNGLIKQSRNGDFKSIVSSVNRSELINIGGRTLIHTAAATNNIEIIVFLCAAGFDINAHNMLGQTPLHLALQHKNFQIVQLLLSLDADILVADDKGISALQICLQEGSQVPEYMIVCFLERLKRTSISALEKAIYLEKVGCSIYQVLAMDAAEIIGLMLDQMESITADESRALLKRAMSLDYPENVKALLKHGPGIRERRKIFCDKVTKNLCEPKMKFYFEQLTKWDVITRDFIDNAICAFESENENVIQMYLDIDIDEYARKNFGVNLLVSLFRNYDIDPIEIVKNRQFNVNALDKGGYAALHLATYSQQKTSVTYLLENGADPNIKNPYDRTVLFGCYNDEILEPLLQAGADVQIVDTEGNTIIDENTCDPIIAYLCILEAKGLLKKELVDAIKKSIREDHEVSDAFKFHREDLEWMKTRKISESITLFTVLVDKVENMTHYVKTKDDVAAILRASSRRRNLALTYKSRLRKNVEKALKLHELRLKAAELLCNVMKIHQRDHLVIEKIISFLNYRDLSIFDKMTIEYNI